MISIDKYLFGVFFSNFFCLWLFVAFLFDDLEISTKVNDGGKTRPKEDGDITIMCYNLNGVRAAAKKKLLEYIKQGNIGVCFFFFFYFGLWNKTNE